MYSAGGGMPRSVTRRICFPRGTIGLLIIAKWTTDKSENVCLVRGQWIVIVCHFSLLPIIILIARHLHLFRYCSHVFTDYDYAIAHPLRSPFPPFVWRIAFIVIVIFFLYLFSWLTLHNYLFVLSLFHQTLRPSYIRFILRSKFE